MDLWIFQAARVVAGRTSRRGRHGRGSLDSLVHGDALAEHAAEGLDPALAFSLKLARALLACGMPAHRVEEALLRLADALGFAIESFCMPTALMVTLAREGASGDADVRTRLVRVEPGATDLEKLSALHDLVGRVEKKELTPGDAARRVDAILARRPRWDAWASGVAYGLVSVVAATLLGGGGLDLPLAAALGLVVGVLDVSAHRVAALGRLLPAVAAFAISFCASALASQGLPVRPSVLLLASIIVLLPGFTVTTATMELAKAHLVAGTARLVGGMVTFLQLGFGLALGRRVAELLPHIPREPPAPALPEWTFVVTPLLSAIGYTVLLRARPKDLGWILVAVTVALIGSQLGGRYLGAETGAFVGALAVAATSHAFARWADRPASLMLVPGILMLVPGSIGFLSISSLLANDVEGAVSTAFRMALVAMALAAGLLVATAAIPPRKAL